MEKRCDYCSKELEDDWSSEWDHEIHYKVNKCSCGKKHWVSVDFLGSGHDKVMEGEEGIESAIMKVHEIGYF